MIVRFVEIGGIVDHHCLNFPFKRYLTLFTSNRFESLPEKFSKVAIQIFEILMYFVTALLFF